MDGATFPDYHHGVTDLSNKVFVFLGRLGTMPRPAMAREVEARGGLVRRGVSRRTTHVVVGHDASGLLHGERLQKRLQAARRSGAEPLSENAFLRMAGLLDEDGGLNRALPQDALTAQAGLDGETAELLALFDIVDPLEGRISFRDLVAAKQVRRLLDDGGTLAEIIGGATRIRRRGGGGHLAQVRLARNESGRLGLKMGDGFADLDGQMEMRLGGPGNPTADDLFDVAEEAEDIGDWALAEANYRRCIDLDKTDPTAHFNLANVLREQDQASQAKLLLQQALGVDPEFAEAHYNLADLFDAGGDLDAAKAHLLRAIAVDPEYADPLYNLANAYFREGAYADAMAHWRRYLELDPSSRWGDLARDGLAVCRRHLATV